MYPPPHHQSQDIQKMIEVIKEYPLGILVSVLDGKPLLTHIPIIYNEESGKLVAHIDKFNPQVKTLKDGAEVTVVFKGPDTQTCNYIIVHITGTVTLINDPEAAKDTMISMTEFLERPDQKFVLEKENKAMQRSVNYIQAFDISITNWEGKFKLSQDKIDADYQNAKQELIKESGKDITGFIDRMYME